MADRDRAYAACATTGYKPPEKCYAPVKPPREPGSGEVQMLPRRLFGAADSAPAGATGENKG